MDQVVSLIVASSIKCVASRYYGFWRMYARIHDTQYADISNILWRRIFSHI